MKPKTPEGELDALGQDVQFALDSTRGELLDMPGVTCKCVEESQHAYVWEFTIRASRRVYRLTLERKPK